MGSSTVHNAPRDERGCCAWAFALRIGTCLLVIPMASSIAANTDAEAQAVAVLAEQALAWAAANGLMAGVRGEAAAFRHIPVSLCPATVSFAPHGLRGASF